MADCMPGIGKMMSGMVLVGFIGLAIAGLVAAAAIKYLFTTGRTDRRTTTEN